MVRILSLVLLLHVAAAAAEDLVFSGPQVGELLPPFKATYALDKQAGELFDVVQQNHTDPTLLVFVHELTRPGIALTRLVLNYGATRKKDRLQCALIFLSDDVAAAEARVQRARHALPLELPIGIAVGGQEGPGAYGLNKNVELTILVAHEGKVTANFALVQPSLAADGPKIGAAVAEVLGDQAKPTLAQMGLDERGMAMQTGGAAGVSDQRFRSLLQPVINKRATPEQVREAAQRVEEMAAKNAALKERLGTVARRIIDAGRLENYGTQPAQEFLRKWAEEYAAAPASSTPKAEHADAKSE